MAGIEGLGLGGFTFKVAGQWLIATEHVKPQYQRHLMRPLSSGTCPSVGELFRGTLSK